MDTSLNGKRVLVTGAGDGIGREIAEALAREGAVVAVHGRSAARISATLAGEHDLAATRVKASQGQGAVIGDLLNTELGQKLGYRIARSRVFRTLSERLNRTGNNQ
jgi:NAD(P)-dependent dehydrogenase (short-subunit alcohol dehydrogenase family)